MGTAHGPWGKNQFVATIRQPYADDGFRNETPSGGRRDGNDGASDVPGPSLLSVAYGTL